MIPLLCLAATNPAVQIPQSEIGTQHAVIVGISEYAERTGHKPVPFAAAGARRLGQLLKLVYGFERVTVVTDEAPSEASAAAIRETVRRAADSADSKDQVFIFFSGAGGRVPIGNTLSLESAFICSDADPGKGPSIGVITAADLWNSVRTSRARHILFAGDFCYTKGFQQSTQGRTNGNYDDQSWQALLADPHDETTPTLPDRESTRFTFALVQALQELAQPGAQCSTDDLLARMKGALAGTDGPEPDVYQRSGTGKFYFFSRRPPEPPEPSRVQPGAFALLASISNRELRGLAARELVDLEDQLSRGEVPPTCAYNVGRNDYSAEDTFTVIRSIRRTSARFQPVVGPESTLLHAFLRLSDGEEKLFVQEFARLQKEHKVAAIKMSLADEMPKDVPSGHWASASLANQVQSGSLLVYFDGLFRGGRPLTRFEVAQQLYANFGHRLPIAVGSKVPLDIPRGSPAFIPSVWLCGLGGILDPESGNKQVGMLYADGAFRGERVCSRYELAVAFHLIAKALEARSSSGDALPQDVPENSWAAESVSFCARNGIIGCYPDRLFRGGRPSSRYEMIVSTDRLCTLLNP